jgi:DNA-binding response OmpR family regulator
MNTALIVEDDKDQAALAAQLVKLKDFQPIIAEDGETGYRLAKQCHPDVVLLDLMLPDVSGFEICRRLRSDRSTLLMPIVMLTALSDSQNRQLGYRVGANAYVTKPYGAEDLFGAIDVARRWQEQLRREHMQGEIHVELNSETTFLQEVNDLLSSLLMSTPLTEAEVQQIRQAVMEMGQNAIEWGNRHRVEDLVLITYRIYGDRVEIVIRDQGPGFDRSQLPHAAQAENPVAHLDVREKLGLREGGFGMLISQGMVDELRYNDPGNEVTLIKRFGLVAGDGA